MTDNDSTAPPSIDRRAFMKYFSTAGLGTTLLPGVLWSQTAGSVPRIEPALVKDAAALSGLEFTDEECEQIAKSLRALNRTLESIHETPVANSDAPAFGFDPRLPGMDIRYDAGPTEYSAPHDLTRPEDLEDCAFWPVMHLAALIQSRQVTPAELTDMYLARLKRVDEKLNAVVTLTEDRARAEAAEADKEIAAGNYRGPLHGIPYGLKDIGAAAGHPTTWGAMPYREQSFDHDCAVAEKLNEAGAILIAKLSSGALALGDQWFGGQTMNPWNLEEGSSGSSAGPASAVAAGAAGFAIGSETLGSIVSPGARCGVIGLRPTFGRVSRYGFMALSWTMDKIGPMCRSAEDCAAVFDAIYGRDPRDTGTVDAPFAWDATRSASDLRIGYVSDLPEDEFNDIAMFMALGVDLERIELPEFNTETALLILRAEAAAAFDDLTRSNRDDELVNQSPSAWPNTFRTARMIPAVEYIQAQRIRRQMMQTFGEIMKDFDVIAVPASDFTMLALTNLTGHPSVVFPGALEEDGTPAARVLVGRLYGESDLLLATKALENIFGDNARHPEI